MELHLDTSSREPLHLQIVDRVRHLVATSHLRPGERLPTVRALAGQLGLNPNTVARAYGELERSGVLCSSPGRGTFVADTAPAPVGAFREDRLRDLLGHALMEALSLGYTPEQIEGALALQSARWRALREVVPEADARPAPSAPTTLRIAGSHDLALDLLIGQLRRTHPEVSVVASNVGSLAGLIALARGEAQVAGCHLLDEDSGEYNLPFIRRILPGEGITLVSLVHRQQGLMVARGNPKGIIALKDLVRPDVVLVNRQRGAGTRVLLDLQLRRLGIPAALVRGYQRELETHTEAAAAVANGSADVALGILPAARALGLHFIPLARERFDLAIPDAFADNPEIASLLSILRSEPFKNVVQELGGYDTTETGSVVDNTMLSRRSAS